jgi:hypothetical protein
MNVAPIPLIGIELALELKLDGRLVLNDGLNGPKLDELDEEGP